MITTQETTLTTTKQAEGQRRWHLMDANGAVLGRLASRAAVLLRGKHKRFFSPSADCGDFVIVTNAGRVKLTGNKITQKTYFTHSGYAKGAKVMPIKLQMQRDPTKVVYLAVRRMLPPTRLRKHQMRRLKIYRGAEHPHAAQFSEGTSHHD